MKHLSNIKKAVVLSVLAILIGFCLYGHSPISAQAKEVSVKEQQRYYTCVEIQKDDTLWSIASEYAPEGISTEEYIEVLKSMNGMKEDVIHYGKYLTVMYVEPEGR